MSLMCDIVAKRTNSVLRWINKGIQNRSRKVICVFNRSGISSRSVGNTSEQLTDWRTGLRAKDIKNSIYLV